jgi:hypothetical protein
MTAENAPDPTAPDTIVLIHGLWVTPRSSPSGPRAYAATRCGTS